MTAVARRQCILCLYKHITAVQLASQDTQSAHIRSQRRQFTITAQVHVEPFNDDIVTPNTITNTKTTYNTTQNTNTVALDQILTNHETQQKQRAVLINKLYATAINYHTAVQHTFNYIVNHFDRFYRYDSTTQQYIRNEATTKDATKLDSELFDLYAEYVTGTPTESNNTNKQQKLIKFSHQPVKPCTKLYNVDLNNQNTINIDVPSQPVQLYIAMRASYRSFVQTECKNRGIAFSIVHCDAKYYQQYHRNFHKLHSEYTHRYQWNQHLRKYIPREHSLSPELRTRQRQTNKRNVLKMIYKHYCSQLQIPYVGTTLDQWITDNNNILHHIFYSTYRWRDSVQCYARINHKSNGVTALTNEWLDYENKCFKPYDTVHPDIYTVDAVPYDPAYVPPKLRRMLKKVEAIEQRTGITTIQTADATANAMTDSETQADLNVVENEVTTDESVMATQLDSNVAAETFVEDKVPLADITSIHNDSDDTFDEITMAAATISQPLATDKSTTDPSVLNFVAQTADAQTKLADTLNTLHTANIDTVKLQSVIDSLQHTVSQLTATVQQIHTQNTVSAASSSSKLNVDELSDVYRTQSASTYREPTNKTPVDTDTNTTSNKARESNSNVNPDKSNTAATDQQYINHFDIGYMTQSSTNTSDTTQLNALLGESPKPPTDTQTQSQALRSNLTRSDKRKKECVKPVTDSTDTSSAFVPRSLTAEELRLLTAEARRQHLERHAAEHAEQGTDNTSTEASATSNKQTHHVKSTQQTEKQQPTTNTTATAAKTKRTPTNNSVPNTSGQRREATRLLLSPNVHQQHKIELQRVLVQHSDYNDFAQCTKVAHDQEQRTILESLHQSHTDRIQQTVNTVSQKATEKPLPNIPVLLTEPKRRIADNPTVQAKYDTRYEKQLRAYKLQQQQLKQQSNTSTDTDTNTNATTSEPPTSLFGKVVQFAKGLLSTSSDKTDVVTQNTASTSSSDKAKSTTSKLASPLQTVKRRSIKDAKSRAKTAVEAKQLEQQINNTDVVSTKPSKRRYDTYVSPTLLDNRSFDTDVQYIDTVPPPALSHQLQQYVFPNNELIHDSKSIVAQQSTSILQLNTPVLQQQLQHFIALPDTQAIDYGRIPPFTTPSRDMVLAQKVKEYDDVLFVGSTSSTSSLLIHLHYVIARFRPIDVHQFTSTFHHMSRRYSRSARKPTTVLLRRKVVPESQRVIYAIDNPPSASLKNNQVLIDLGKVVERQVTMEPDTFKQLFNNVEIDDATYDKLCEPDAYAYMKYRNILFRAQLDCSDPGVPCDRKVFDLKSRATLPIRLDCANYKHYTQYRITKLYGELNSYEREYYDMARSAFLKYSMQCRIGHMAGVFVAYHNTVEVFGLQYIPVTDMNCILFGNTLTADTVYEHSIKLMNEILTDIHSRVQSIHSNADVIKLTVVTDYQRADSMHVFAEWHSTDTDVQSDLPFVHRHSSRYLAATQTTEQIKQYLTALGVTYDLNSDHNMLLSQLEELLADLAETSNKPSTAYYCKLQQQKQLLCYTVDIDSQINGIRVATQSPFKLSEDDSWTVSYSIRYRNDATIHELAQEYKRVLYRSVHVGGSDDDMRASLAEAEEPQDAVEVDQQTNDTADIDNDNTDVKDIVSQNIYKRSLDRIQQRMLALSDMESKSSQFKHSRASHAVAEMLRVPLDGTAQASRFATRNKRVPPSHTKSVKPHTTKVTMKLHTSKTVSHTPKRTVDSRRMTKAQLQLRRQEIGDAIKQRMSKQST